MFHEPMNAGCNNCDKKYTNAETGKSNPSIFVEGRKDLIASFAFLEKNLIKSHVIFRKNLITSRVIFGENLKTSCVLFGYSLKSYLRRDADHSLLSLYIAGIFSQVPK